jgi:hypothetical protein
MARRLFRNRVGIVEWWGGGGNRYRVLAAQPPFTPSAGIRPSDPSWGEQSVALPLNRETNMAKYRVVNTRFWDDTYVAELSPNEKLAFLYLLTNALTTIGGVYELSLKRAAFDVGLPIREMKIAFEKFESDQKIVRRDDWIGIVNFVKHQSLNPKVKRGIEIEHEKAPRDVVQRLNLPPEFFSLGYRRVSDTNINKNRNSNGLFSTVLSPTFSPERTIREELKVDMTKFRN